MSGRLVANWTIDVDRPPEAVFDYLVDVSKHVEWSPKPYRTDGLEPGPVSVGTSFTSRGWVPGDSDHVNVVTVTAVDRPTRLVLESKEKDDVFVNTFVISAAGSGSRVERTMDMPTPGGVLGFVFPLAVRLIAKPNIQKGMDLLKTKLETSA